MATLQNITRASLLKAIAEYDRIGPEKFHAKHGTAPSPKYCLRHGGKSYPSKAIVAAAAGLSPKEFSGGRGRLGKLLERAGFALGALAFVATSSAIVRDAAAAHEPNSAPPAEIEATYFASGSNRPPQIRGFASIGQALGVTAPELSENAEDALHALAGTGVPVFVDSGAFSEVEFSPGPKIVRPIEEQEWQRVLDLYGRLAATLGPQLYVVAPDCVGFQDKTLERIERWRGEVRALISSGVNVIVVSQKGVADQVAFDARVEELLGTNRYVRGLPCNKGATTPEEVARFAAKRKPKRIHLLGLGLRNERLPEYARAVAEASPETRLSLDSCLICESSGTKNGRVSHPREMKGGPRIFTWAKQIARKLISDGKTLIEDVEDIAIRLAWGDGQVSLC